MKAPPCLPRLEEEEVELFPSLTTISSGGESKKTAHALLPGLCSSSRGTKGSEGGELDVGEDGESPLLLLLEEEEEEATTAAPSGVAADGSSQSLAGRGTPKLLFPPPPLAFPPPPLPAAAHSQPPSTR